MNIVDDLTGRMVTERTRADKNEEDSARYRWLRDRLVTANFGFDYSAECVLVFSWPRNCSISGNFDEFIDQAMIVDAVDTGAKS